MGRKAEKTWEEMTELERLREENERLRTEVAFLKKLREARLRDEAKMREQQRQLEKWLEEDFRSFFAFISFFKYRFLFVCIIV